MPITSQYEFTPLDQTEFGKLSYDVVADVLAVRHELGRFFDEKHYKKALTLRRSDVDLEVAILVSHHTFQKTFFLDAVIARGGVFEFKAAEAIVPRHKSQLLQYLMLAELWHGLLINVRPEKIGREYVNNALTHQDRIQFTCSTQHWDSHMSGADQFQALLVDLLRDWGTCLDLSLYEEAITHFCGGDSVVIRPARVSLDGHELGTQTMRFVTEKTAFKLTAFGASEQQKRFASHAQRLVNHTDIESLLWADIGRHEVTFTTLTSKGCQKKGDRKRSRDI